MIQSGNIQNRVADSEHAIVNGTEVKKVVNIDSTGNLLDGYQATKITVSGSVTYVAVAPPGTAQSSALWQVQKIDTTSGTVITWADSNANFDNIATDLTSLNYS